MNSLSNTTCVTRPRSAILGLLALLLATALFSDDASAQAGRYPTTTADSDFGASPDSYLGNTGSQYFYLDRGFDNRPYGVGQTNGRSRDPAPRVRDADWQDRNYDSAVRSFPLNDQSIGRAPRTPAAGFSNDRSWETRYSPRPRPYDVEDLPQLPRGEWNLPVRTPTAPVQPTVKPEPTLSEKVQQRYADPRVVRLLQQSNQSSGESLYAEISQYIDQRHVQPTSYQQRVRSGLEHLVTAVQTASFQQALGIQPTTQTIQSLQQGLGNLAYQTQPQDLNQAIGVMRQAGQLVSQSLRVNPAAVSLPFVYGALDTLDKFSMFVAPEKSGETSMGLQTNMVGIGVEIESHPQGLKILKAISGGPAAAATLQRGDIITGVNGKSVAGLSLNQAAELIAGPSGSTVQLQLRRDNLIGDLNLVRRPFDVHSVAEVRMEAGDVGYIKLDQFTQTSTKEMESALWKLHNQGMKSLILDLRGNPGGLLTTAIEISNQFLPSGTIVSTRGRTASDNSQEVAASTNTWKVPLVVLVDHNSASASEIFAAAVQENGRGLIVGEKSYGKGTVQTLFPLKSVPSALRLTTAKFYSPDGREMAGTGVTPDINVTSMTSGSDGNDPALQAALRAATDRRVIDMATRSAQADRSTMKVIRVVL